ncbi:MAG: Cna B-type domain-containing protein [Blautia sp.]|nr:Cna B-type domain-containing protein [Blautia sp.]
MKKFRRNKFFKGFSTVIAAIVVFTTTYSLILPAISIEYNTAQSMPGLDVPESRQEEADFSGEIVETDADGSSGLTYDEAWDNLQYDDYGTGELEPGDSGLDISLEDYDGLIVENGIEGSAYDQTVNEVTVSEGSLREGSDEGIASADEVINAQASTDIREDTNASYDDMGEIHADTNSLTAELEGVKLRLEFDEAMPGESVLSLCEVDQEYYDNYYVSAGYELEKSFPDYEMSDGLFYSAEIPYGRTAVRASFEFDPPVSEYQAGENKVLVMDWCDGEWHLYDPEKTDVFRYGDGAVYEISFETDALYKGNAGFGVITLYPEGDGELEADSSEEASAEAVYDDNSEDNFGKTDYSTDEGGFDEKSSELIIEEAVSEDVASEDDAAEENAAVTDETAAYETEPGDGYENAAEEELPEDEDESAAYDEEESDVTVDTAEDSEEEEAIEADTENAPEVPAEDGKINENAGTASGSEKMEEDDDAETETEKIEEGADAETETEKTEEDSEVTAGAENPEENTLSDAADSDKPEKQAHDEEILQETRAGAAGSHVITVPGEDYKLRVTYGADAGIPADAVFTAIPVSDEDYESQAIELVENKAVKEGAASLIGFIDLVVSADGRVIAPTGQVEVTIEFPEEIPENEKIYAVHFPGTGEQPDPAEAEDNTQYNEQTDVLQEESSDDELMPEEDSYAPEDFVPGGYVPEAAGLLSQTADNSDELIDITDTYTDLVPSEPFAVSEEDLSANLTDESDTVFVPEESIEPLKETAPEVFETAENGREASFTVSSFSYIAIVSYTVDFHWQMGGRTFEFSLPGGGFVLFYDLVKTLGIAADDADTEKDEIRELVDNVQNIEFSNPELLSVSKVSEDTTVGDIKTTLGLECEYSAELNEDQINEINSREAKAGDWALISLKPFDTEESLTVTMKNGDVWTVNVTDDQVSALSEIDGDKEYILYTKVGEQYYVLKGDGSTEVKTRNELDTLDIQYKWKISHIYTEWNGDEYYHVIPASDSHKSLALNWFNESLVKDGNDNQVVIAPYGDAFAFYGYNHVTLSMKDNKFNGLHRKGICLNVLSHSPYNADQHDPSPITIYEPAELAQYAFNVNSDDYAMGKVCGKNNSGQYKEDAEYDALTNYDKFNRDEIKAVPQTARYIFDYWDLNGERIENGATIPAGTLSIPYQGSKLTAHFKKDPNYEATDEEKEGRVIDKESFQAWLKELRERNIPLDQDACTKTAELYDYENRIYRVDLTAKSNLSMFDGDIDLGFIIDVSGSMQFPSKLIPVPGLESVDLYHINDNYSTKHQLDTGKEYYVIVDRTNRADVLRLRYNDGANPAYPNHTGWPTGNPNSSSTQWLSGWGVCGLGYDTEEARTSSTRYLQAGNALFNGDEGPFRLYDVGDNGKRRKEYLESSIAGTISELNSILSDLAYANDASEAADVKVAYNTFANDVDYNHTNHNFVSVTDDGLAIGYDYKGGTDTEEALIDAQSFDWSDSATKVAVLITDGAPQQSGVDGPTLDAKVKAAANTLKGGGVKLVTVGLSMGDVKRGSRLLYDIATKDSDGDPYFYKADTGDELQYVLYEVIQQVMADAIVVGNVTDTVNEAFYPVDKNTGIPLETGNVINLEGIKIADDESSLTDAQKADGYGVIGTADNGNYTVTWNGQNFTWDGWHGTVYEKAKEDFLGGNAVRTNDPEKPAGIVSEGYKIRPEDPTIVFKPEIRTKGSKTLETPRVNVNELDFTDSSTEWTVYLGTEVDPKLQLEALYDKILVKEVVTAAEDVNNDGFPDRMTGTNMYYPLLESISDVRESSATGEQVTFRLKDFLKNLNNGDEITIDEMIAAGEDGITLTYDRYGQDCPGSINIKLTKTGETAEYDPHTTTRTGDAVEKYDLTVVFSPDYVHVPVGQGGTDPKPYHTGDYGLAFQGNAAGEDYSTNTHVINVYEVPLDVYKTDENDAPLAGASFKLYKIDDENGSAVPGMSDTYKYVQVAYGVSGNDGIAQLKNGDESYGLKQGETYYLVESAAPTGFVKVNTVWTVEVQTEIGKFTDTEGNTIYSRTYPVSEENGVVTDDMYPFNWDQGARVMLDGNQPVVVITKGETEGSTAAVNDGSFVSHKKAVSFRHTVKNIGGDISVHVHKTWNTQEQTPDSITVKLYRVGEKDHKWGKGSVVPCSCTETGVEEYTCEICGKTDTHVISAAGHTPGEPHRENETAATCTTPGSYDTVVRCKVCNAIISTEHTDVPMSEHTWGEAQETESATEGYCYDSVVRCTLCGAEKENSLEHYDHEWGEWQVTTPAQINVPGEETAYCAHDPKHTKTQPIDPLPANVKIYFRCTGNGSGRTEIPGQITNITQRSGTGFGDMTIQWDWNQWTSVQPFDVDGLSGGNSYSTYSSTDGKNYNNSDGVERGKRQTLTISNITKDLTIYITIRNGGWTGTDNSLIYQPSFAGIQANAAGAMNKALRFSNSALRRAADTDADEMPDDLPAVGNRAPLSGAASNSSMTTEALQAYLDGLKNKDEATCEESEGAVRIYKQELGEYTISAADQWKLDLSRLPKYNEYGKEYKYYIVEQPATGYDTTYTGQESGLKDGSTDLEIINTPKTTDLTVTKAWAFAPMSNVTKAEGKEWPEGVTVHVVVYSKTGESDPAPTDHTVDLTADQPTYTFSGLPEYSGENKLEYSVVEAGVTGLDSTHFNTVIEGNAESGYTIKNTEKEAGLTIIKSFEGDSLTDAEKNKITFTVTGSGLKDRSTGNSAESLTRTYAEFAEGQWVLNGSDGIAVGGHYTVTENNANTDGYIRVTTVRADDGDPASFDQKDAGETNPSTEITMGGYQSTVTITNTYTRLLDLTIVKVDSNGMTTKLKGAKFELRKIVPDSLTLSYQDSAVILPETTGEDHKTGTDGEAKFTGLAPGYYEVKETETPAGYIKTGSDVFYVRVENGEISHVERTETVDDKGSRHVT